MKAIRNIFITVVLLVSGQLVARAQLLEQYSSVNRVKYAYNKAYGGMSGEMELDIINRTQWQGIEGNPQQLFISVTSPLYMIQGGVGMHFSSDRIGLRSIVGGGASYNYVLENDLGLFSIGLGVGYKSVQLDRDEIRTPDGRDMGGVFSIRDDFIDQGSLNSSFLNYSMSVLYANGPFEIAASWYQDMSGRGDIELRQVTGVLSVYGEYDYTVNSDLDVIPYAFIKTSDPVTQAEIGVAGRYLNRFSGGLGVRGFGGNSFDAVVINVGFRISEKLGFAYYYDAGLSSLAGQTEGSHELLLKYAFGQNIFETKPVKRIYNPRY